MTDAIDRRLMLMGGAVAGLALGGKAVAQRLPPPSAVDTGRVEGGKVAFPEWRGEADPKSAPPPASVASPNQALPPLNHLSSAALCAMRARISVTRPRSPRSSASLIKSVSGAQREGSDTTHCTPLSRTACATRSASAVVTVSAFSVKMCRRNPPYRRRKQLMGFL